MDVPVNLGDAIVSVISVYDSISASDVIPSPLAVLSCLQKSGWSLNTEWQTAAHIHKVLNDLLTKQHFSDLHMSYLPELCLVAVAGVEPEAHLRRRGRLSESVNNPLKATQDSKEVLKPTDESSMNDGVHSASFYAELALPSLAATDEGVMGGPYLLVPAVPESESGPCTIPVNTEGCSSRKMVFVIPGNFRTGTISGRKRRELRISLELVAKAYNKLGYDTQSGWIVGITDGDDVSYYVEKVVTLRVLKESSDGDGTRDSVLSKIFGIHWAVNLRTVARKKEKKDHKKRKHLDECLHAAPDDVSGSFVATEEKLGDTVVTEEKYDDVLSLINAEF